MINKVDKFKKEALDEMFKRVGFDGYDKSFTDANISWYTLRTWTEKEESDYKGWFIKRHMKVFRFGKAYAQSEMSWFILNFGWKTKYD